MSINNEMCFGRFDTVVNVEIPSPGEANSWKSVFGSGKKLREFIWDFSFAYPYFLRQGRALIG